MDTQLIAALQVLKMDISNEMAGKITALQNLLVEATIKQSIAAQEGLAQVSSKVSNDMKGSISELKKGMATTMDAVFSSLSGAAEKVISDNIGEIKEKTGKQISALKKVLEILLLGQAITIILLLIHLIR